MQTTATDATFLKSLGINPEQSVTDLMLLHGIEIHNLKLAHAGVIAARDFREHQMEAEIELLTHARDQWKDTAERASERRDAERRWKWLALAIAVSVLGFGLMGGS